MRYSSPEHAAQAYEDHAPPTKQKPSRVLPWIIGALVIGLLALCSGIILTAFNSDATDGVEPISTSTIPTPPATTAPKAKAPAPSPTKITIPAGTWIVGTELPAGKYRTEGAEESFLEFCSWSITAKGGDGDIIDAGSVGDIKEPARVTLKKGQAFRTSGCQEWVKQ